MAKMPKGMKAFEKSGADKKEDASGAKKAGMSLKKFEGSAAEKKGDAKALKAMKKPNPFGK